MRPVELEIFLSKIEAQLADLPPARRIEILDETRSHLEAMLAAHRADGLDEASAWQKTARDFGDANEIGRELAREWKRAPRVETVGAPLTKEEKISNFVRLVPWVFFGIGVFALQPWLTHHHLKGVFYLLMSPIGFVFAFWNFGRTRLPLNAETLIAPIFCFVITAGSGLTLLLSNTSWGPTSALIFNNRIVPIMVSVLLVGGLWLRRGAKKNRPWRRLPRYASNPIGAEEEYSNLTPSLLYGAAMGGVGGLLSHYKSLGLWLPVSLFCAAAIANLLYRRFRRHRA